MTALEYLAVASIVLLLGLKIHSVYRESKHQAQIPSENILTDRENSDIQYVNKDIVANENIAVSKLDWSEIYLIVVGLGFCAPFGLILLWKTDRLDSKTKTVITFSYVAIVVVFLLASCGSS